jgi:ssDNA-binding Zn-finger/Zn-ribbon topoisomerase 1
MSKSKDNGDAGELEVVKLVPCPNCGKGLMVLPKNYPLYDVQCVGCNFRAQIKTSNSKPKSTIFGAGWDIMEKVLKSGFLVPSLIVNFKWEDEEVLHQEIRFYPFVPKINLKKHQLSPTARRANYKMFNYIGIDDIPFFTLYKK